MPTLIRALCFAILTGMVLPVLAQEGGGKVNTDWPGYQEGDYVIW
jgi:hypothetical protein